MVEKTNEEKEKEKEKITKDTKLTPSQEHVLGLFKGKTLDIGCRYGHVSIKAKLLGKDVTACDISEINVEKAKEIAKNSKVDLNIISAQIENLPFEKGTFDTVYMGEIIEHLTDPKKGVEEALRVLKVGGKLIITTPCGFAHYDPDHKTFFFTINEVEIMHRLWVFDLLPKVIQESIKICDVDAFFKEFKQSYKINKVDWKSSTHPSLDYFIELSKKNED